MFAELMAKAATYKMDAGYATAAACPATPNASGADVSSCIASGQPW